MPAYPTASEIAAELARRDLHRFVERLWPVVVPGSPFVDGFHIRLICEALEAVAEGTIRRLLINVPPRHAKSLLTSIFFPAFLWLRRPETRFLAASYGQALAAAHSRLCRTLIESAPYRELAGDSFHLAADQNQKEQFANDRGGMRVATSVGGAVTGFGADIVLLDDPAKAQDGSSPGRLQATTDWFDSTVSTRLNSPISGAFVIVGHRVHEDDLFGHLLELGGWEHIALPAEYESSHPYRYGGDPRSQEGELLWPERFTADTVADLKKTLGSYGAAGQLQQRPTPAGGGILRTEWFNWYSPAAQPTDFDIVLQSWDLTFGNTPGSDFVVGQLWGRVGADSYLLRQIRKRLSFNETLAELRAMKAWTETHLPASRGHAVLIEKGANGQATVDVLKAEIPGLLLVAPRGSKIGRAEAITPQLEAGNVWLPGRASADGMTFDRAHTAQWAQELVREAASFPNAAHDDQVDALSQALIHLGRPGPRMRMLRL